ncbi:MAG: glycoside hydrolase family 78 protein [Phycisphaerae bacterium]|nr:glycoside hydrolase family 78 protein [Phycisphaerae bacterium]
MVLAAACSAAIRPERLRCEHLENPSGIDVAQPRLSWIVTSDERAQKQSGYRILVASSAEKLKKNQGDLWDSGRVPSDQTVLIPYGGKPLASAAPCWWKVKVWDGAGDASAWSAPARWSMGLLHDGDWKGAWIGLDHELDKPKDTDTKVYRPSPYLRKEFTVDKPVRRAVLYATALGIHELRLNGRRVGDDYFMPGWTDYKKRLYYQTCDVTDMLNTKGRNALGAILSDGWYAGNISILGQGFYGWHLRFRGQLNIEYADGSHQVVATDPSWTAAFGPILESDMQAGETYDARLEMPGWDRPGFDAAQWRPVAVTEKVDVPLQAYPSATTRIFKEIPPKSITTPAADTYVLDMGTNFAGWARLKVRGNAGDKVRLRFAERLNPDGTIYTENLRSARATDTYICKGGGLEEWQPQFTFHGFQYVEVTGYPGRLEPDAVIGVEITAAVDVAGSFACSSEQANALYRNICQTQRANFIEIPTDCPQRDERMGWTGDAQIYVRTATYNADVAAFIAKYMVDVEDGQYPDGGFPCMAPRPHDGVSPAWADAGVICPWTIYRVYGDRRIIERHYDAMTRWLDYCRTHSKDLIRPADGFGDWLSINADTPKDVLSTAYFARSTSLMAEMAAAVGKTADAEKYRRQFADIKQAFNKAFVAPDGRIKGSTQTVYVLALAFDLLDEPAAQKAADHLAADIRSRDGHLSTGFVGTKDLMPALTGSGRLDVAYRLFNNDTFPSWGFSIRHGATSIWERWNGWTPDEGFGDPKMNSFAHYSFGAVAEWMFKTIGGIDLLDPGYKRIAIRPAPGGGLDWANAAYDSIRGRIASNWKINEGTLTMDVHIPANTTAEVYVPTSAPDTIKESNRPARQAKGVTFLRNEKGAAVFELASGDYRFTADDPVIVESAR